MAFTFLFLSLFSWCVFLFLFLYFLFSLEIPNTFFYSHFQLTLQFPALLMETAGWSLDGGAEAVFALLPPILQILDLLRGFSTGKVAKLGPWGEIVSTTHSFVISAEQ